MIQNLAVTEMFNSDVASEVKRFHWSRATAGVAAHLSAIHFDFILFLANVVRKDILTLEQTVSFCDCLFLVIVREILIHVLYLLYVAHSRSSLGCASE
jgi:hypothetical protein